MDVDDDDKNAYTVVRQNFKWHLGLSVRDFRYAGRIANVESDAMFNATGQPDYLELIRRLHIRVRGDGVNQVFYMERLVWEAICTLAARKTQSNAISQTTLWERPTQTLYGVPVRTLDAMAINETAATT